MSNCVGNCVGVVLLLPSVRRLAPRSGMWGGEPAGTRDDWRWQSEIKHLDHNNFQLLISSCILQQVSQHSGQVITKPLDIWEIFTKMNRNISNVNQRILNNFLLRMDLSSLSSQTRIEHWFSTFCSPFYFYRYEEFLRLE